MYIAESHRLAEKFREALALYDRVVINVRSAIAHFQQCDFDVKVLALFGTPRTVRSVVYFDAGSHQRVERSCGCLARAKVFDSRQVLSRYTGLRGMV